MAYDKEIEQQCKDWVMEGLSYPEIKRKLKSKAMDTDDIYALMNKVDEFIVLKEKYKQYRQKMMYMVLLGVFFFLLGASFILIDNMKDRSGMEKLWLAVMAVGAWLYYRYRRRFNKPIDEVTLDKRKRTDKFKNSRSLFSK